MGLREYSILFDTPIRIRQHRIYVEPPRQSSRTFLIPTAKEITLAELNGQSRDAVTAHRLADYRHRRFSLVLLPNVQVAIEDLWDIGDLREKL